MKMYFTYLFAVLFFGTASPALATLLEARITYGALGSSPDLTKVYTGTDPSILPGTVPTYGIGGDVIVFVPMTGFGVGLRYENLGITASTGSVGAKITGTRTALIVTDRFIDTILHIGPIFTYGLSHSTGLNLDDNTNNLHYQWSAGSATSYSVGLDANISLIVFLVGAEAGWESLQWNSMSDSTKTSSKNPDLNMSGSYGKVYIGFSI